MRVYKTCGNCNTKKLSLEFAKHQNKRDGLNTWCKLCNKKNAKRWYKNNNSNHRKNIKRRTQKYRETVQRYLIDYFCTHFCVDCGESNPVVLEFDHRDPYKKNYSIGRLCTWVTSIDLTKLYTEIQKCDVRCANCHRIKTARERKYTRYKIWSAL